MVELIARELLGAHVLRCAERDAGGRQVLPTLGLHRLGDPEVHDLDPIAAVVLSPDHDVLGLQVTVDNAEQVSGGERVGNLHRDPGRARCRNRTEPLDRRGERVALDVFHGEIQHAIAFTEVVDLRDVWVIDAARVGCLAIEAADRLRGVGERRVDHLHRALSA